MKRILSSSQGCTSCLEYWVVASCLQSIVIAIDMLTVQAEGSTITQGKLFPRQEQEYKVEWKPKRPLKALDQRFALSLSRNSFIQAILISKPRFKGREVYFSRREAWHGCECRKGWITEANNSVNHSSPSLFFFLRIIYLLKKPNNLSCGISHILDFSDCMPLVAFDIFLCSLHFLKLVVRSRGLIWCDFLQGSFIGSDVYFYQDEQTSLCLSFCVVSGHHWSLPGFII